MQNKFLNNVSLIKEAINNDRLVIFAGAGVSKDSGIPLWGELINELKNYLNEKTYESDSLKIAQILYNEKGEKEYNEILKDLIFKSSSKYNSIHEIIFELNPQHIITTNYDNFFESIIKSKGLPFSVVSKDIDLPYAKHKNLLVKYHGDFDNHNTVFKENDYLEFSKNNTLKEIFVKSLFSNKVILFVGYSVSDINLKMLIRDIQFILKKHHQRTYLLTHNENVTDSEIKYFENLGINIVNDKNSISNLSGVSAVDLSNTGLKVYQQLKFIAKDFNLFEYRSSLNPSSESSKIINDLHKSLIRFYYFRVIPSHILKEIYPLNKNSREKNHFTHDDDVLILFDLDLYNLIKNYGGKDDENLTDDDKKKLNYILVRLIQSGFFYVGIAKDNSSQGYWETKEQIEIYPKILYQEKCECIDCTLDNYDYPKAIKQIDKYVISDDSDFWEDLVFAYGQYKTFDFYNSFKSYKLIEIKANKNDKMELSFLAKYNMKRLSNIAYHNFMDRRYEYDDLKEIKEEAEKINLDDEILKVKYFVDEDVYKLLKEIKDGVYIQRLCNQIDDNHSQISKTITDLKKGNFSNNSPISQLYKTTTKLHRFLNENFIIGNSFSDITPTFKKSINTLIFGYYLGTIQLSDYPSRLSIPHLKSFNSLLFRIIIDYGDAKEIVNIIKENFTSDINFDQESSEDVFNLINNFLKCSVDDGFHTIRSNETFISYMQFNRNFKSLITSEFDIICCIIAYFKFSNEQINELYKNLNYFLKYVNLDHHNDTVYVNHILNNKYKLLEKDSLLETLKIFNDKKLYNNTYTLLIKILDSIDENFINQDFDINTFDFGKRWLNFHEIFKNLNKEQKDLFKRKLSNYLEENPYDLFFYYVIKYDIVYSEKIKSEYIKIVSKNLERKAYKDISPKSDNDYCILRFFDLVNQGKINDFDFEDLKIKEQHYNFILNPEKYNPEKFEVEWLKIFDWDSFLKRFSKIDYILSNLEIYLIENFDKDLSEIYFKIKKYNMD